MSLTKLKEEEQQPGNTGFCVRRDDVQIWCFVLLLKFSAG
jgi:hypothetical protein